MMRTAVIAAGAVLVLPLLLPSPGNGQEQGNADTAHRSKAPDDAHAYILWPRDGAVVSGGKLWVRMGLQNMGVAPAGVAQPDTGHHHLLVDTDLGNPGEPIPNDRQHLHFGGGQTEARLDLPPGRHTLQMVLGDADHVPHDPPVMSQKITVTVR
ncbi:DUF4399 domain-containing protein [Azospirillum picis]|uniref:DUF4399 domain-containing protein n=1 Tax=Azospirillum picis TaxID=488438 RepID=A0ABU0MQ35_9PROT|nr:DUF4399 domain-containing protein [Azospirillum picis]MBP2302117.1 hypothetical protein [Azospirillum picis]MDQ0535592.1 hypothetical protein [Azospirillum picis]